MKAATWSSDEVAVLVSNQHLTNTEVASMLPARTVSAVNNQRKLRGIGRTCGTKRQFWTEAQYVFMRENPHMTDAEMARALGVRLGSLSAARKSADIRKVYRCAKCNAVLGSQGKWCNEHTIAARRWSQYANKAKDRGIGFDLTHDDLHDLLDKPCTYCNGDGGGIDRIDSSKGYEKGNVAPCCWRCNAMKNNLVLGDWIAHMKKIISHTGGQQ